MVILVVIQFLIIGGLIWYIQTTESRLTTLREVNIRASEKFLRTTAAGVLHRFSKDSHDEDQSPIFLSEMKIDFIAFAAQVIQRTKDGTIYLTHHSTFGHPHFEIERADGTYAGMAIVQSSDLTYETIALLHSHIIQQQAQGGYVVTTGDFTPHAYQYAQGLEIELINGKQFVTYWLHAMDHIRYEKEQPTRTNRLD